MTYSESAEGQMISEQRVHKELRDHGMLTVDIARFHAEVKPGKHGLYDAVKVLEWLGY